MRTRTTRPQPPAQVAARPPRLSDQAPPSLPRPSTHPLPPPPFSSRPSLANPTTRDRKQIVTRATTSSAPAQATLATRPTVPRRRARRTKTVMTIGSRRPVLLAVEFYHHQDRRDFSFPLGVLGGRHNGECKGCCAQSRRVFGIRLGRAAAAIASYESFNLPLPLVSIYF